MGSLRPMSFTALTCLIATAVMAQERLPTIPPDQYTAEQKAAAEEFLAARKVPVFGPFEPLMYSGVRSFCRKRQRPTGLSICSHVVLSAAKLAKSSLSMTCVARQLH